jgi:hypothetical protein
MKSKIIYLIILLCNIALSAQMKVGSNSTSISSISNFEVEANDGTKTTITKDNGKMGVGTLNPSNLLHIKSNLDPIRAEGLRTGTINDSLLIVNDSGIIRKINKNTYLTASEPWYDVATNKGAFSNSSNIYQMGNVGIGTSSPVAKLDVLGDFKLVDGTQGFGKVLTSDSNGKAKWQPLPTSSGSIVGQHYVQGTTSASIGAGSTANVPGMTLTITVPAGTTQTLLFTINGYMITSSGSGAGQGVFSLFQNGTKISSAYASCGDGGSLINLPHPTTFLKAVTLSAGTYTFLVKYTSWANTGIVNYNPTNYLGYNGDTDAMLTRMQVLVYNN